MTTVTLPLHLYTSTIPGEWAWLAMRVRSAVIYGGCLVTVVSGVYYLVYPAADQITAFGGIGLGLVGAILAYKTDMRKLDDAYRVTELTRKVTELTEKNTDLKATCVRQDDELAALRGQQRATVKAVVENKVEIEDLKDKG